MALVANLSLPDWDEWRIQMLERRRRKWRDRVRDRVRVRVVAGAHVSIEGVAGPERAGEKKEDGKEEDGVIKEAEEKEGEGGRETERGGEEGEKNEGEMIEGDERVVGEEEGGENVVEREEVSEEVGEEVREEVEEEENGEVGEEVREEENGDEDEEKEEEDNQEVVEEVREEVREEEEEQNREEDEEKEEDDSGEGGEEEEEEENGEEDEENEEEENEEVGEDEEEEENGKEGEMEVEEMQEHLEENAFERKVEEAGGELENEVEYEVDSEEEEEQVEEEVDGEEEHQEQEPDGQNPFAEQLRRTEDENIEQETRNRQDSVISEAGNSLNSVESDDEDSDGDYYNFDRINNEDRAVVKQYKPPKELGGLDQKSWMNKNSILGGERKEKDVEKLTGEKVAVAAPRATQEVDRNKPQTEEEESTDDEEDEESVDEDEEDSDDEDVVKVYSKDDYPTDLFRTLTQFKDSSVLTDLTLITKNGTGFHVHSSVLAAVSSLILRRLSRGYFRRNVRNQMRIQQWSVSLGPEVDSVGLEAIVQFAYTGLITCLNNKTVHNIRAAAETLGAPRVLQLCKQEEEKPFKPKKQREEEMVPVKEQLLMNLQSIKQLWMDKVGCDVILEALGGSIHVHRVILAVSSDYFRGMFTSGMRETNQPTVSLPHLLSSELEVLIGCSYSGDVPLNWKCVFEITMIALQLQYQPVLSLSLNFLHQEINPHSCLDLASFAEAFDMVQLLEAADDFVLRQFQKVACTTKFKDLPAKQLLKYLNSRSLCVPSELVVFKAVVAWIQAKPKIRLRLAKELMKTVHFPLMTFKEFKEVQSLNMWSDHRLAELFEAIYEEFCSNESQCRIYLPKESLILIGGDHTSEDLANRSISRELWFGNSLRNHTGVKKAMEWRKLGDMPEPERFSHEVAVLKGQLYVFGGKKYYGLHDNLNSVYRYDPLQNSWESLAEMMDRRCSFSVVVLDEKIYAIGGHCDPYLTDSVEQYCPMTNSWSFSWPLDLPLGCHVAKVLQGQIYVSGGLSNENQYLASMILYNPEAGSTYLANMAKPRARHCMETLGEYLYVAGGITANDDLSISDQLACEVYNPVANCWTAFTPLPVPHVGAAGAVLEGKFYVLGGYSQEDYSDTKMVHRYDPATQRWENMGNMPGPNNDIRASVLCLPPHFRS